VLHNSGVGSVVSSIVRSAGEASEDQVGVRLTLQPVASQVPCEKATTTSTHKVALQTLKNVAQDGPTFDWGKPMPLFPPKEAQRFLKEVPFIPHQPLLLD
jgi:hypothetical protein